MSISDEELLDARKKIRELEAKLLLTERQYQLCEEAFDNRDNLLWWLTAIAGRVEHDDIARRVRQLLATQGYTRENLEKR